MIRKLNTDWILKKDQKINKIGVVDLFCGIGGLSHGFIKERFNVLAGYDIDDACKYAFEKNNKSKFICADVGQLKGENILKEFSSSQVKILVGCAPCQPFSSYTFKEKVKSKSKWGLLYDFLRIIKEVVPDVVSMENVAQLVNFKRGQVFDDFIEGLKNIDYFVSHKIVNCPDYGIPQKRKRLVLLASKLGQIDLIEKTHNPSNYKTVKDAIGDLPEISDGESHPEDRLHFARKLSPLNKKRIKFTPYGGSWKDWPQSLVLDCHKKKSGKSYSSVYGRMKWEEPAPTITTHCIGYGNGRFGHPVQDRGISLREAAILQTFPENYDFFDPSAEFLSSFIARQLGNAVPVELGRIIAKSIKKHLENNLK